MQFKNPEVFYFLALLLIPVLVHLFQLQRFVKVPFSNVAFLQKLVLQTRKSARIKKWLILSLRLLLFLAILFAFSQPYFSNKELTKKQHTFIYLDNSLSINSSGERGNLLQVALQELIDNTSDKYMYSLQTNEDFYAEISKAELKKVLLNTKITTKKMPFSSVLLKINEVNKNKTKTLHNTILISDFQNIKTNMFTHVTTTFSAIQLTSSLKNNISIDSVFISTHTPLNYTLNVVVKNQGKAKKNVPIAIYNNNKLVSKKTFSIPFNEKKEVVFTIQNKPVFSGKIKITFSDTYSFDNVFYFYLKNTKKTNVLSIGNDSEFLAKIYTDEEFQFSKNTLQNINYNNLTKQHLIVLNELENIPEILTNQLLEFLKNGGHLVIIPNEFLDRYSYTNFLSKLQDIKIGPKQLDTLKITDIHFNHPLFSNVFSKKVSNFQYPNTKSHYPISSVKSSTIIALENQLPFLSQINTNSGAIYLFSSAINKKNSNFLNSPLIVPVFYNFAQLSFHPSKIYFRNSQENKIDIATNLQKDAILSIANKNLSFIPMQQTYTNKVVLFTNDLPSDPGFYAVLQKNDTIEKLAYNYPKEESSLQFLDINKLQKEVKNCTVYSSIQEAFSEIDKKNEVQWLWKLFLSLAIVSLLLEILILKFYKP